MRFVADCPASIAKLSQQGHGLYDARSFAVTQRVGCGGYPVTPSLTSGLLGAISRVTGLTAGDIGITATTLASVVVRVHIRYYTGDATLCCYPRTVTVHDVLCLCCDRMYEGRHSSEDRGWQGKAIKS
jgi:hypothetical protein